VKVVIKNDADQVEGVLEDVEPEDVEQLKAELPLGWYVDD
jgi:hypothetical protein